MKILNVTQGSPDWIAVRAKHFCASDAAAMMGASKRTTRTELLRMKSSGDEKEFSAWTQANLLDKGHQAEAAARSVIEANIGQELYPATGTDDAGLLLASFDGITIDGEVGFENKLWNEDLAAQVRAGELPPSHYWQLEQQCLVGGLKCVIFVVSNEDATKLVRMEYMPVPGRAEQLLAGWKQFAEDVKNYQHVEVLPAPTGKALMKLPALTVSVMGHVTSSNLAIYQRAALDFIGAINTVLQTDEDFATAENTVKFCADAESELESVKRQALAQTASIDELFRTVDTLKEAMRAKRLELDKLVKARKDSIREDIRIGGMNAVYQHVKTLNQRLGKDYMPATIPDFGAVMKGKKTITSLRDAVDTALAHWKISANEIADRIDINLKQLAKSADYAFLFADAALIVQKAPDDLALLISSRIVEHKAKEQFRLDAEREKIRQEEAAKIAAAQGQVNVGEHGRLQPPYSGELPMQATGNSQQADRNPAPAAISARRKRPTDEDMIAVLAAHYRTTEATVVQWLDDFDIKAATKRTAKARAA